MFYVASWKPQRKLTVNTEKGIKAYHRGKHKGTHKGRLQEKKKVTKEFRSQLENNLKNDNCKSLAIINYFKHKWTKFNN